MQDLKYISCLHNDIQTGEGNTAFIEIKNVFGFYC